MKCSLCSRDSDIIYLGKNLCEKHWIKQCQDEETKRLIREG